MQFVKQFFIEEGRRLQLFQAENCNNFPWCTQWEQNTEKIEKEEEEARIKGSVFRENST